jgi:hypothetical protein
MKTCYYSIRKNGLRWSECKQYSVKFQKWVEFAGFCKNLALHFQKEIRACQSAGYDNQGYYFNPCDVRENSVEQCT